MRKLFKLLLCFSKKWQGAYKKQPLKREDAVVCSRITAIVCWSIAPG